MALLCLRVVAPTAQSPLLTFFAFCGKQGVSIQSVAKLREQGGLRRQRVLSPGAPALSSALTLDSEVLKETK